MTVTPDRPLVVFILSTPHAGSTWLNLVLGSHSWSANLGEYQRPFNEPGHVACRLCEANGLDECVVLHGIEKIDPDDAFHFAAERTGKPVLIDASKSIEWCQRFLDRTDIDVKIIHLFRNPCGVVDSLLRRSSDYSYDTALDFWESRNRVISAFLSTVQAPWIEVCYEELADRPDDFFPTLCDFIGRQWEPAAEQYWSVEHHGLGGNGAASLYLRDRSRVNYVTRDEEFYASLKDQPVSADRRWEGRLPREFQHHAMMTPYVAELRARFSHGTWPAPSGAPTADTRFLPDLYANGLAPGDRHYRAYVGPPADYDLLGALSFRLLTSLGLREFHKVLDFGCGSLGLGRLLIPYLEIERYCGVDPNAWLIKDGLERQVGLSQAIIKRPVFHYFDDFEVEKAGGDFDFIVAHAVFSHTGRRELQRALVGISRALSRTGFALVTARHPVEGQSEFQGDGWVYPQSVAYGRDTLQDFFRKAGLVAREIPFEHPREHWYLLATSEENLPGDLFGADSLGGSVRPADAQVGSRDITRRAVSRPGGYRLGSLTPFSGAASRAFVGMGFSGPEDWGRWTDGPVANLALCVEDAVPAMVLELWIGGAFTGDLGVCPFTISINSEPAIAFEAHPEGIHVVLPVTVAVKPHESTMVRVAIRILHPRPVDVVDGGDQRALGLAMASFQLSASEDRQ